MFGVYLDIGYMMQMLRLPWRALSCRLTLSFSGCLKNPRDSLTSLEEEAGNASYSQNLRQWRRGIATTVGVKKDSALPKETAVSGFRWKKKWRERKKKSKEVRQLKTICLVDNGPVAAFQCQTIYHYPSQCGREVVELDD